MIGALDWHFYVDFVKAVMATIQGWL